jgi:acyl-CoA reductase-like NAD-dependent aldehyde dehydrogenase
MVTEQMSQVRVGAWYEDVDMGPLISAAQAERVLEYVSIGVGEGARLTTGGERVLGATRANGHFVQPTVFAGVEPGMRIAQEEIFGPVLTVIPFGDATSAIEIANDSRYGLAAAVWTTDLGNAIRVSKRLEVGQVYVNTFGPASAIGAPFGGYKQSGFGRLGSADSLNEYTQQKAIVIDGR